MTEKCQTHKDMLSTLSNDDSWHRDPDRVEPDWGQRRASGTGPGHRPASASAAAATQYPLSMSPRTAATSRGPTHKFAQFLQPLKVCSNRADRNSNLFIERTRPLRQTGGGRDGWDSHLSCFVVSVTNDMSSETCHEAKSQTSLDPLICISWHTYNLHYISTCRCYLHNCTTGEVIQQYPAACWLQVACAVFRADCIVVCSAVRRWQQSLVTGTRTTATCSGELQLGGYGGYNLDLKSWFWSSSTPELAFLLIMEYSYSRISFFANYGVELLHN